MDQLLFINDDLLFGGFENTNFDPNKGKTEEIKFAFTS